MRVGKSECSIFKELYRDFIGENIENETMEWMCKHREQCSYCREWSNSVDSNKEDIILLENNVNENFNEAKNIVRKGRMFMTLGIGLIVFVAFWMSIWHKV